MDSVEKIGTIVVMALLIGVLANSFRRSVSHLPDGALNTPAAPRLIGPAYLTSALPLHRRNDDYSDPSSYYLNGSPYTPENWGD